MQLYHRGSQWHHERFGSHTARISYLRRDQQGDQPACPEHTSFSWPTNPANALYCVPEKPMFAMAVCSNCFLFILHGRFLHQQLCSPGFSCFVQAIKFQRCKSTLARLKAMHPASNLVLLFYPCHAAAGCTHLLPHGVPPLIAPVCAYPRFASLHDRGGDCLSVSATFTRLIFIFHGS